MKSKSTRNTSGSGSIRQRKNGSWEGRYSTGRDPITGKQIQVSVYGKTKTEVAQIIRKKTAEIDSGSYIAPSKMSLEAWLDIWLRDYCIKVKDSTKRSYRAQCNTNIIPTLGKSTLSSLTTTDIQRLYTSLLSGTDSKKALAPKSIKNVHVVLNEALGKAKSLHMISENPCREVVLPRIEKPKIHALNEEQISSLLKITGTDSKYGPIYELILFTGLREGEALGLTWDCVSFDKGTITISKQLQKRSKKDGGYTFTTLKNDKPRIIMPAPYVMELLKHRYDTQMREYESAGAAWNGWRNEEDHKSFVVFSNEIGGYINPKQLYLRLKRIANIIGAPEATVHGLRHTYATISLENGDDPKTVQENLGHASASFTLDVYGHISTRMRTASASNMEHYIQSVSTTKGYDKG